MKVLKETKDFKVYIDGDIKVFESKDFNYHHNLVNGYCETWGKTKEDDPEFSGYGPIILDLECTTVCGHNCKMCYKSNTINGENMSFETFKKVVENVNYNQQLQSVAFGLGATGTENPDLWKMCEWLRKQYIIPNGTLVNLSQETAKKVAQNFGAVAISLHHGDFEVLANTIAKLTEEKNKEGTTLKQINIHQVIYEENFEETLKLINLVKVDERFKELNAIVFLGLKKCGRGKTGFNIISEEKFDVIVSTAMKNNIGIGFDSCSCSKTADLFKKKALNTISLIIKQNGETLKNPGIKNIKDNGSVIITTDMAKKMIDIVLKNLQKNLQSMEPCEGGIMSSYVSVDGYFYPCSFNETKEFGFNVLENNFEEFWNNGVSLIQWRDMLKKSKRSCPTYEV